MTNFNDNQNEKAKGQHFLLSSGARTLNLKTVFRMTDDQAWETFKTIRWPETVACAYCGYEGEMTFTKTRKVWRCRQAGCKKQFGITTNTVFAYRKLALQDYLAAVAIYVNQVKGVSMLQLSRDLDVQYKTAFVLSHKIRETIHAEEQADNEKFDGDVEVDGAYFAHKVRPKNHIENRVDRRKKENQSPNKSCVFVIRERGQEGASRSKTFVIKNETPEAIDAIIRQTIEAHARITADGSTAYDNMKGYFQPENVSRVNHTVNYVDAMTGASTNQAESFFSRMRRGYIGQHHKMSVKYMANYASEFAFRENYRRESNGMVFTEVTSRVGRFNRSESRFVNYWQRKPSAETGSVYFAQA